VPYERVLLEGSNVKAPGGFHFPLEPFISPPLLKAMCRVQFFSKPTHKRGGDIMKKIIIIFMALLLGLFIEVSSAVEVNLLGPNKYKRTTGKPNFFTEAFQGELGTGKLIILNGEANGENRVSSALILLNGTQVIGPKSFNQKVYNIEIPVSLSENNSISVELRSSPGSYLTIQVKEEMTQSTRPVGPGGGILKFHNGVILDVPADAVTEETAITVKDLKCSDVDAIVTSEINVFHPKRCLGGFSAEPTNLVFQLPVTATLPVLLLEPGELPIQLTVDLNNQIYSRGPTDLIYYGDQGVAEIKILHFSHLVVTAEEHVVVPEDPCQKAGLPEEECKTKSVACESCDYNKNNQDLCNKLNPYAAIGENSCCTVPPKARAQCWGQGGCDCCTEKRIHVVASAIDFASTDACQIVSENVTVTFLDCHVNPSDPQSPPPTMTDSASEAS
jgi:hypothetical protein